MPITSTVANFLTIDKSLEGKFSIFLYCILILIFLSGSNPTNPFLGGGGNTGGNVGGNYNYGRTGKGEDEFIRRSFQV